MIQFPMGWRIGAVDPATQWACIYNPLILCPRRLKNGFFRSCDVFVMYILRYVLVDIFFPFTIWNFYVLKTAYVFTLLKCTVMKLLR
jgi:hypothetical protein